MMHHYCSSLKQHGFTDIVLTGDHGENQRGMKAVAERLHKKWGRPPVVHFIPEVLCTGYVEL